MVADLLRQPIDDQVACIVQQRGVVAERLRALPVVERVYPSDANFLLVKVRDADAAYEHLVQRGIIVRNRNRVLQCAGCLRITIGLPQENEKMLQSLAEL